MNGFFYLSMIHLFKKKAYVEEKMYRGSALFGINSKNV